MIESQDLFGIPNLDLFIVLGILLFFVLLEVVFGYWKSTNRKLGDWIQEAGSFLLLSVVTKGLILTFILFLGNQLLPHLAGSVRSQSLWILVPTYILIDDFLQYWYHRSAHEYSFLWKLHRAHHQAEEMGFFISYRNAALYYYLMPNIYWMGVATFLGGGIAVAIGLILKQLVIVSSHSTVHYDKLLYNNKWLNPVATIVERIFVTPAFHHAHHGKSKADGISDPNANFGNMFSIWDQLFGSAVFTREFPKEYGLQNDPKDHWAASMLYPVIASSKEGSEISRDFVKRDNAKPEAIQVDLVKGEKYLWCTCGKSNSQPFCDGSHHGTKFMPMLFKAKRTGAAKLCQCKLTKTGPFCDNSHLELINHGDART
ncbi:sterol desaturase family protein [Chitinophagales bacterium]|nr:sterol desaturase family protein [Chitinophagales bacterium]